MKLLKIFNLMQLFIYIFILIKLNCFALNDDVMFIKDFFKDKNVMLTINTCWTNSKIKLFLRNNMVEDNPKPVSIYKNLSLDTIDTFFGHLSGNNWFLMDFTSCMINENILRFMNENKLFRYPLKHLILVRIEKCNDIFKLFEEFSILPMTNIVIAGFKEYSVQCYQPYKIGENECLIIEDYGTWVRGQGINISLTIPMVDRRRNFQNYKLQVGTVVNNNESIHTENIDDITEYRADEPYYFQDIPNMFSLLEYLNASYEFRVFNSYGYLNQSTGKLDGMTGDLAEDKSHITGVTVIMSEERQKFIEYIKSYGYWSTKSKFILKKPATSYVENIYYTTFANNVWIATFIILLIFAVVLYNLLNWEINNMNNHVYTRYTVSDVTLLSLEAICQQGTYLDSKTYSGRTIILIMFTAFMFVYIAYSSYILVLLQSTKPITSIRQLVDSRIECGGFNVSFMMAYYTLTKDENLIELYRKKIYPNKFYSLKDGLKKVQKGNFAFQIILGPAYSYILKKYTNYDICKLQELRGYMNDEMYIAVPKPSQYKKLFKTGLLIIEERGLQSRVKNRMSIKPRCYNEAGNFQSVRIYDCYSVIILYAVGVILALVVLLVENILVKYKNRGTPDKK